MHHVLHRLLVCACVALSACTKPPTGAPSSVAPSPEAWVKKHPTFEKYWYQGAAELTRYALRQSRYGEARDGDAVLVFVTEDFLTGPQVKRERGDEPAVSVLKLNAHRRFWTGIYPYSVLTSVFAPAQQVADATPLKVVSSVQEWCGQAYIQMNHRNAKWEVDSHSYFQNEADSRTELDAAVTEDQIWTQIRIDPSKLPVGAFYAIPALHHVRFAHVPLRTSAVTAELGSAAPTSYADTPLRQYTLRFTELARTVKIWFDPAFPHVIHAWEERDDRNPERTTHAVRTHALVTDYWNHNHVADARFREALGFRAD